MKKIKLVDDVSQFPWRDNKNAHEIVDWALVYGSDSRTWMFQGIFKEGGGMYIEAKNPDALFAVARSGLKMVYHTASGALVVKKPS